MDDDVPRLIGPQADLEATLIEWFEDTALAENPRSVAVRVRVGRDWGLTTVLGSFVASVADRALVIRIDGRSEAGGHGKQFVEAVDEALATPGRRAVAKVVQTAGLASGPGILGWAFVGVGAAIPVGLGAAVLAQLVQEPAGKAIESLGRWIDGGPVGRAAVRLAAWSSGAPVVIVVDHAEQVDDALAEPLARLIGRSDLRLLLVVAEQSSSAFVELIASSVRRRHVGEPSSIFDESPPDVSVVDVVIEHAGSLEASDVREVGRVCQTLGAAARLVNSRAVSRQPESRRSLSGLDLPQITARRDGAPSPAAVVLAVVLGGSVDAAVFAVACDAAGIDRPEDDPLHSSTWWTSGAAHRFTVRADQRSRAEAHLASTFGDAALVRVAGRVVELVAPTIMACESAVPSLVAVRYAEAVVALGRRVGPSIELAKAASIVLGWTRRFGLSADDIDEASRVIEACEAAGIDGVALDELRANVALCDDKRPAGTGRAARARILSLPDAGPERLIAKVVAAGRQLGSPDLAERSLARDYLRSLGRSLIEESGDRLHPDDRSSLLVQCALALAAESPTFASELLAACEPDTSSLVDQLVDLARVSLGDRAQLVRLIERATRQVDAEADFPGELRIESLCLLVDLLRSARVHRQLTERCPTLIRLAEAALGAHHRVTLMTRVALTEALLSTGRFHEAIAEAEALRGLPPLAGYPLRFAALALLTLAYREAGSPAVGLERGEEGLSCGQADPTLDQLSIAGLHTAMSACAMDLGQYDRALELARAAHAVQSDAFGRYDSRTLNSLQQIGRILLFQHRFDEAIETGQQLVDARRARHGSDHLSTLVARYQVANALVGAGRYATGVDVVAELHAEMSRHDDLGPEHPSTLAAQHLLAECYLGVGRVDEARDLATRLHRFRCEHLDVGPLHPNTISTEDLLAKIAAQQDDVAAVVAWSTSALQKGAVSPALGPNHPQTAMIVGWIGLHASHVRRRGVDARAAGRLGDAETMLAAALTLSQAVAATSPSPHRLGEMAAALLEHGVLRHERGERPAAIEEVARAADLFEFAARQEPDEPQHRINEDNARAWLRLLVGPIDDET